MNFEQKIFSYLEKNFKTQLNYLDIRNPDKALELVKNSERAILVLNKLKNPIQNTKKLDELISIYEQVQKKLEYELLELKKDYYSLKVKKDLKKIYGTNSLDSLSINFSKKSISN